MKTFEYVAVGCEGQQVAGEVEAADEAEARKLIEEAFDESCLIRSIDEIEECPTCMDCGSTEDVVDAWQMFKSKTGKPLCSDCYQKRFHPVAKATRCTQGVRGEPMTMKKLELEDAIANIDSVLGKGYARAHPELIGALLQAEATERLAHAVDDLGGHYVAIHGHGGNGGNANDIAQAIERLANAVESHE